MHLEKALTKKSVVKYLMEKDNDVMLERPAFGRTLVTLLEL